MHAMEMPCVVPHEPTKGWEMSTSTIQPLTKGKSQHIPTIRNQIKVAHGLGEHGVKHPTDLPPYIVEKPPQE